MVPLSSVENILQNTLHQNTTTKISAISSISYFCMTQNYHQHALKYVIINACEILL